MTNLAETRLSSTRIFDGRTISLRVDTVLHPDGSEGTREVIEHPGAAAMVPLLPNGDVVLVRQYRTAAARVLIEIPAGTLERGETPEECARREIIEEIGHTAANFKKLFQAFVAPGYSQEMIHAFLVTDLTPLTAPADADEFIEIVTMPLDNAVALIATGEIEDGKTIAGLLCAQRLLAGRQA